MPTPEHRFLQTDLCARTAPIIFVTAITHGKPKQNLVRGVEILLVHVKTLPVDSNVDRFSFLVSICVMCAADIFLAIFARMLRKFARITLLNMLSGREK